MGDGHIGNEFWLLAEHGIKAGYVRNIERDPHVRLKLREGLRYRWHEGTAHLLLDDDPRERWAFRPKRCDVPVHSGGYLATLAAH